MTLTTDTDTGVATGLDEWVEVLRVDVPEIEPTGAPAPRERDRPVDDRHRRVLQAVVLSVPVVILAGLAWTHRNVFVDGYIYLHVVQNVLAGNGPVFNAGQRVEAFTSPAWTLLLSIAGFALPWSLVWISVVLGIAFSLGGVVLALAGSTTLARRASPGTFVVPMGALVFVALPPIWSLATTGLETGLEFLWLGGCLVVLVRWSGSVVHRLPWWGLVVLGLGPLVRPELLVDSLVFVAVLVCMERSASTRRERSRTVAWAAALPVLYEIFRMGYYGALVANTATAKEATLPRVGRGIEYFADFVGPYWLFIPAIALLVGAYYPLASAFRRSGRDGRPLAALLALPTAGLLNALYIIVMGGDYVHARLLVAPFFAACAPVAAVPLARRYLVSLLVVPWALVCALTFRTTDAGPWASPDFSYINGHGSLAPPYAVLGPGGSDPGWHPGPGVYVQFARPSTITELHATPAPGIRVPVIATSWIGYEPYHLGTDVQILDLFGLADPLTAHLELQERGQISGHEKPLPTPWIAALLTADGSSTARLGRLQEERPHVFTPITPAVTGRALALETAWARAALRCPDIRDIVDSPSAPLTPGTFLANIVHSVARTDLRIPADPEDAYHQFCGPGTPPEVRTVENA